VKDKHFSLFGLLVDDEEKMFKTLFLVTDCWV
jgi:hypothetical protein